MGRQTDTLVDARARSTANYTVLKCSLLSLAFQPTPVGVLKLGVFKDPSG